MGLVAPIRRAARQALDIVLEHWRAEDDGDADPAPSLVVLGLLLQELAIARGLLVERSGRGMLHRCLGPIALDDRAWLEVSEVLGAGIVEVDVPAVEVLGAAHEDLLQLRVMRSHGRAVCLDLPSRRPIWLDIAELTEIAPGARAKWLTQELGFDRATAKRVATVVGTAYREADMLKRLEPLRAPGTEILPPGSWLVQSTTQRRKQGAHYTPRELTDPTVRAALEPLLARMGPRPGSDQILALKVCDPAMGSGAFLVEVVRQLAPHLVDAWTRERSAEVRGTTDGEALARARLALCKRSIYGVDKSPDAVQVCRWALWLEVGISGVPIEFMDHALRCGDALVGVSWNQLKCFHWRTRSKPMLSSEKLTRVPGGESDRDLNRLRVIADVLVGIAMGEEPGAERERRRRRALERVVSWIASGYHDDDDELARAAGVARTRYRPFHWFLEFPQVYGGADGPEAARRGFDLFIGNPPFSGGRNTSETLGTPYTKWLVTLHGGGASADLCAHFLRRCDPLLASEGIMAFVTTNTISQGDTREIGLRWLVGDAGYRIYRAIKDIPWPGAGTTVTVSVVHMARGPQDRGVVTYDSRLRVGPERTDPEPIAANRGLSFQGSIILGKGFLLTPEDRAALIARDRRNAERIFPYLGGEEVNHNPDQSFDRYVIDFGEMSEDEARTWPDLWAIVQAHVGPERRVKDRRRYPRMVDQWWKFWNARTALYQSIAPLDRCLVTAAISKHVIFSFQPTDRVFSHKLFVFPFSHYGQFALMQSRCHEIWVRLLSSTLGTGLNYAPSDCFENFPFPADPRDPLAVLEPTGRELETRRQAFMRARDVGLTKTYNLLKDPGCADPEIAQLRALHEQLDREVLTCYGWSDIEVPSYSAPRSDEQRLQFDRFSDLVLARLFARNYEIVARS